MATASALPSFEQLMASLGLQDESPSVRSLAAARYHSHSGPSPSIVVSPARPEDFERERERAVSHSSYGRKAGARYSPYLSDNRDIYSRRGSLPDSTTEVLKVYEQGSTVAQSGARSASSSPRAQSIDLDSPLDSPGLQAQGSSPVRELTLLELEMNFANAPISSLVRRSHQHSPSTSSTSSSTSAVSASPTSLAHRRRRRSGSSSSSSRSSPPPGLSIPALPALISMPMSDSSTRTSPNAHVSRRAPHQIHRQRSSGSVARISAYRPYPSPTEASFTSAGFHLPPANSIRI